MNLIRNGPKVSFKTGRYRSFKRRIFSVTKSAVPMCQPTCCFTSWQMFNTNGKDVLPAEKINNIIYLFTCDCGHRYVGKTTQRLEERVKQHVPGDLVQQVTQSAVTQEEAGTAKEEWR